MIKVIVIDIFGKHLSPSRIVMYGEYLDQSIIAQLSDLIKGKFGTYYIPEIELCDTLDQDIKRGLTIITHLSIEKEYEERI